MNRMLPYFSRMQFIDKYVWISIRQQLNAPKHQTKVFENQLLEKPTCPPPNWNVFLSNLPHRKICVFCVVCVCNIVTYPNLCVCELWEPLDATSDRYSHSCTLRKSIQTDMPEIMNKSKEILLRSIRSMRLQFLSLVSYCRYLLEHIIRTNGKISFQHYANICLRRLSVCVCVGAVYYGPTEWKEVGGHGRRISHYSFIR